MPRRDAVPEPSPPVEAPRPVTPRRALQSLTETLSILLFLAVATIPVARVGLVPLDARQQVDVLVGAGLMLVLVVLLHRASGFMAGVAPDDLRVRRRRDDAVLDVLSVVATVLIGVIAIAEVGALLVFTGTLAATAPTVVTVAGYYAIFATFSLLFLVMMLVARASFQTRYRGRAWHDPAAYALLAIGGLVAAVAFLKNHDLLNVGPLAQVRPDQTPYLITLTVLFELVAFRWLLRYPPVAVVFASELEIAKRAHREERELLERRALRAYLLGLVFVLVSFLLIGGVATGRVATGGGQNTWLILFIYVGVALITLGLLFARFVQHRVVRDRSRREEKGEVVAGRRLTAEQRNAILLYAMSGVFAAMFATLGVLSFVGYGGLTARFATDFLVLAFLIGVGPFGFRRALEMRRIRAMDDKFPDFLRDLAEGLRAGMTLPRSLFSAAYGTYGALTPEIKRMSAQVEWGVSFTESLQRFAQRVRTPLIQRTVSLINEASHAGGSVVDILTAAANDSREIKQILEDRRRQMGIYSVIIYIAFVVFLVVIYVLSAQFIPSFQQAVQGSGGTQVGGVSLRPFETATYVTIFFHAALVQGVGSGLVAGVMTEGHPLGGLKHSFVMAIIAWVFFRLLL